MYTVFGPKQESAPCNGAASFNMWDELLCISVAFDTVSKWLCIPQSHTDSLHSQGPGSNLRYGTACWCQSSRCAVLCFPGTQL